MGYLGIIIGMSMLTLTLARYIYQRNKDAECENEDDTNCEHDYVFIEGTCENVVVCKKCKKIEKI